MGWTQRSHTGSHSKRIPQPYHSPTYDHTPRRQPSKSPSAKLLLLSTTGETQTQGTLLSLCEELPKANNGSRNTSDFAEGSRSPAITCQAMAGLQLHLLLHLAGSQFLHTCPYMGGLAALYGFGQALMHRELQQRFDPSPTPPNTTEQWNLK